MVLSLLNYQLKKTMLNIISKTLAILTIGSHFFLIIAIFALIFFRAQIVNFYRQHFNQIGIILAFVIALVSMVGSLFYSEIMKFAPCNLCWWQRICMYPQSYSWV